MNVGTMVFFCSPDESDIHNISNKESVLLSNLCIEHVNSM